MLLKGTKFRPKKLLLFKIFALIFFATTFAIYFLKAPEENRFLELSRLPKVVNKEEFSQVLAQKDEWKKEIEKNGPDTLHNLIKSNYPDDFYGHEVMHIFGELLYETEGLKGVGVCDDTYTYGCYHAFFGRAIRDKGVGIIGELMEGCRKNLGKFDPGCQHGLGHGLVQFFGYDRLEEANKTCDSLPFPNMECREGVVMESNRVLRQIAAIAVNDFKEGRQFLGCYNLGSDQIDECFYKLPLFWDEISDSDFRQIDALCSFVSKDALHKETCYRGMGRAAALTSQSDTDLVVQKCQGIKDYNNLKLCLYEAYRVFSTEKGDKISASRICEPLEAEERLECLN